MSYGRKFGRKYLSPYAGIDNNRDINNVDYY